MRQGAWYAVGEEDDEYYFQTGGREFPQFMLHGSLKSSAEISQ